MKRASFRGWPVSVAAVAVLICCAGGDWLRFRGPGGSGFIADARLPVHWKDDKEGQENIDWKVRLPGKGCSCPLVVGDRVIVTCADGYRSSRLLVVCYNAKTGQQLWKRQLWPTGRTMTHNSISPAAPTPVSDGERLFVSFSTNDIACFDLYGNLRWLRGLMMDFPNASNSLGLASSLVVIDKTLVVKLENDSQSLAIGLDADNGTARWRIDRPKNSCWSTPLAIEDSDGNKLVTLQSGNGLTAYDARGGQQRWKFSSGCASMASCCKAGEVLLVPSGGLTAIKPNSTNKPQVLWQNNRLRSSTATPLAYKGRIYVVVGTILKCADLATGELLWQLRLGGRSYSASPVIAGDKFYIFDEDGVGQVVLLGEKKGQLIGGGKLSEKILSTPAMDEDGLYVRGDQHLWRIARDSTPAP